LEVQDSVWRAQVESVVRAMVQPLVADGGRFQIETCDPETKEVVVRASMANCEACTMSEEDLGRLLEEAVQRNDPQARVSVISGS
jgi:Fe-S cluster biogenesis protein NfuA